MKILLILPWEKDYKAYRDKFSAMLTYAPLTLATLAALVPKRLNAEIFVCDEFVQKIDFSIKYDIVAISTITPSFGRACKLAKKFKRNGSYVVFGGYHTTFLPDEAADYADTVIIGAAEKSFPKFLSDFAKKKPKRRYEDTVNEYDYVVPRRDLLPKHGYLKVPCVIANRGCPNRCEFCAISKMNPPSPRRIEDVINEIKKLNAKRILFFDPNFFQNRDYALELMHELEKLKINWGSNSTVTTAFDAELMTAAEKSGCRGVLFGLESVTKKSLQTSSKGFNNPKRYKQAIDNMHEHNISVNGCFVLGFDYDTKESLLTLPKQVEYLGLDMVRYAILTPVPSTKLFMRLESEGRILTKDWTKYTQNKAVFQPENMSPQELEEIYAKVWKDSYKIEKIWKRVKHTKSFTYKMALLGANLGFKYVGINIEK
jgi:radical SAM superfamily enzyme YgiQ (UPF0313 family)